MKKKTTLQQLVLTSLISKCFAIITNQLNIKKYPQLNNLEDNIKYYHEHIWTKKIRSSNRGLSETFTFNYIFSDEIKHEIFKTLSINNNKQ